MADKFGSLRVRELNHLEKELQIDLRKKKYNFDISDKNVDEFFKMREKVSISSTFTRAFFVRNFGAKAET